MLGGAALLGTFGMMGLANLRDSRDLPHMVLQRAFHGRVVAVLGPTNTGKTHFAVERMLAHRSGMIGFPLRLLAREIFDRIVAIKGRAACALITGEEKLGSEDAAYLVCTAAGPGGTGGGRRGCAGWPPARPPPGDD